MIIPVRCFNCNTVLADKYAEYRRRTEHLPEIEMLDATKVLSYSERAQVLDNLGLPKECCRATMLTHVDFLKVSYEKQS